MQQAKAFQIGGAALNTTTEPADRLVHLSHFVPYDLPGVIEDEPFAMTPNQIDHIARLAALLGKGGKGKSAKGKLPKRVSKAIRGWSERGGIGAGPKTDPLMQSNLSPDDQITGQLGSEFGLLFLDRTRIRPAGFVLGEHLTSISLAPGEETTIEQKTFTKVEQSFEETKEDEKTKDQELSSSYSNELSESLEWQLSLSKKSTNTSGGKISGSYEGIGIEASNQTAKDLTDGDTRTARDSLKLSETTTRKISSKQRQQHKIVMRLSQESRFESGSKRVIRNANTLAPIDLVYFKIMQRLQMSQERYGLRLCWAPAVADPAGRLFAELEKRRLTFMAVATAVDSGPAPISPTPPTTHPPISQSVATIADKFDPVWGGQSADYIIDIPAPANYIWDQQPVLLNFGFTASRPAGARILTTVGTMSGVQVIVHVGAEDCRNPLKWQFWQAQGTATITLSATFLPVPDSASDQAYADKMAKYLEDLAVWKSVRNTAQAEATARAEAEWGVIRADFLARSNIVQEVMGALIEQAFPNPSSRDEPWELDLWQRLFDFDHVSIRFYPSWWNGRVLRDPDAGANSFMNASWARVYVPIRPNAEQAALRWLLARTLSNSGSHKIEVMIQKVVDALRTYRLTHFGSEDEMQLGDPRQPLEHCPTFIRPSRCLGQWTELIPTDGTHLEVLQATTSGADDDLTRRLKLQNDIEEQKAAIAAKDTVIKGLVADTSLTGLTSHVEIHVPEIKAE